MRKTATVSRAAIFFIMMIGALAPISTACGQRNADKQTILGPLRFPSTNLHVINVSAKVIVEAWDKEGAEVTITGSKAARAAFKTYTADGTLFIESKNPPRAKNIVRVTRTTVHGGSTTITRVRAGDIVATGNSSVVIGGDTNVVVSGDGNIVIGGENFDDIANDAAKIDPVKIVVKIQRGAKIDLDHLDDDATIGDIGGELVVDSNSGATIRAGYMTAATIHLNSSGSAVISRVNGPLTGALMGSGDIRVESGNVTALSVSLMGSGNFHFGGTADTATLSLMGSGDIYVRHVKSTSRKSVNGSGTIKTE